MKKVSVWLLVVLTTGCELQSADYAVGTIERHRIDLVADSGEPVVELLVTEGDRVEPGMKLLEQDTAKLVIAIAHADAERALAAARLREAESGPRSQEIEQARAQLQAAESALSTAEHELQRQQSLVTKNYATESQVNVLRGEVDVGRARVEEIRARLEELLEGTRSEQIDQARASFAAAEAKVNDLQLDLERATVRAPVEGVVESLLFRVGERPVKGQTLITVLSAERTFARVHIPLALRSRLALGDEASLVVDGHDSEYRGRIRWIAGQAAFTPYFALTQHDRGHLAFLAEIDLVEETSLPSGVPVEARFPTLESDP